MSVCCVGNDFAYKRKLGIWSNKRVFLLPQSNPLSLLTHVKAIIWPNYRFRFHSDAADYQMNNAQITRRGYSPITGHSQVSQATLSLFLSSRLTIFDWQRVGVARSFLNLTLQAEPSLYVFVSFMIWAWKHHVSTCLKFFKFSIPFLSLFLCFLVLFFWVTFKQVQGNLESGREIHVVYYDEFVWGILGPR